MPLNRFCSHKFITSSLPVLLLCSWVSSRMPPLTCRWLTACSLAAVIVQMVGVSLIMLGFFPVKPTLSGVRFNFLFLLDHSLSFLKPVLTRFAQSQRSREFSSSRSRDSQPHHSATSSSSSSSSQILVPGFFLLFLIISSFPFSPSDSSALNLDLEMGVSHKREWTI